MNIDSQEEVPEDPVEIMRRFYAAMNRIPPKSDVAAALAQLRCSSRGCNAIRLFREIRRIGLDHQNWEALATLCRTIGADIEGLEDR